MCNFTYVPVNYHVWCIYNVHLCIGFSMTRKVTLDAHRSVDSRKMDLHSLNDWFGRMDEESLDLDIESVEKDPNFVYKFGFQSPKGEYIFLSNFSHHTVKLVFTPYSDFSVSEELRIVMNAITNLEEYTFPTSEHAVQYIKLVRALSVCPRPKHIQEKIFNEMGRWLDELPSLTPGEVKRKANMLVRKYFPEQREQIASSNFRGTPIAAIYPEDMRMVLKAKVRQHEKVKSDLLKTGKKYLIEGNTWGDTNWGMVRYPLKGTYTGKNKLGRIWYQIRQEVLAKNS